ncbi:Hsp20/alpha crystallin family protein [Candidatus Altiarchaeota archaeon]
MSPEDDRPPSDEGEEETDKHLHHKARKILEESIAMPFFKDHRDHMPMILNLHADLSDEGDYYSLKARMPGLSKEDVQVSATEHSIDIFLTSDEEEEQVDTELDHFKDPSFHSSYYLSDEIEPKEISSVFEEGVLRVKAIKRK